MNARCELLVAVPSHDTHIIQQGHIPVDHITWVVAEDAMFPTEARAADRPSVSVTPIDEGR